ncbi:PD-(D/E)XK nuclease family protein [Mycetocola reblochoni]|uniref:PD-(D/E)XK nuclease family protein n=1 Tax=Mycetocola reblochoni TaxID=331618 RepID=UPI003F9C8495
MAQILFSSPSAEAEALPAADEAQRRVLALAAGGGSVAVQGAPGSGKTALVLMLARQLVTEQGIAPDDLVVIGANRRSATRLRDRVARIVAVPTSGPLARTVASFAHRLVAQNADGAGREAPRLLTGAEQDGIIAEILAGHALDGSGPQWPEPLDAAVRSLTGFRTELRELMMRVTEEGLRPDDLRRLAAVHRRPEWSAAAELIEEYEEIVDSYPVRFLDSAELVSEATRTVRDGEGPLPRVVLVDDLHEQGPASLRLLAALAGRGVQIIATGDPDVAAATFRGSEPGAIARLSQVLGVRATGVVLGTVYRHGPEIRALVREASERVGASGGVAHRAAESSRSASAEAKRSPLERLIAPTTARLQRSLARALRERHVRDGVPWSRMAVVVRSGAQVASLERALALSEVPTAATAAVSPAERALPAELLRLAAVALGRESLSGDEASTVLTGPLGGLDRLGLRRLRLALRHEELAGGGTRLADELLRDAIAHPAGFDTLDLAPARRARRVARAIAAATDLAAEGASIEELLWQLWESLVDAEALRTQALGTGVLAEDSNRQLDGVMALFTSARRFVEREPDAPAGEFIDEQRGAVIAEDTLAPAAAAESVWVGPPSALVGTEWDTVAVLGLQDGAWPNPQIRGSLLGAQDLSTVTSGLPLADIDRRAEVLSDELRLFVLACSRASDRLLLAAVEGEDDQPSPFLRFRSIPAARPSTSRYPLNLRTMTAMLRRDLVASMERHADGGDGRVHGEDLAEAGAGADGDDRVSADELSSAIARLADAGVPGARPEDWYGVRPESTTAPLAELNDPETRVSVSPSRIETFEASPLMWFVDRVAPEPSQTANAAGTLVHAAMEDAALSDDPEDRSARAMGEHVGRRWDELRFESDWLEQRQRRRVSAMLTGVADYLSDRDAAGTELIAAEGDFALDLAPARLRGQIDRVERDADGTISIVDLKTGRRAPTGAELAGHAQLIAYQLAARSGQVPGVPEGAVAGGALLFVGEGHAVRGRSYRLLVQAPLSSEDLDGFIARVRAAAEGMAGSRFRGAPDADERSLEAQRRYRIQTVPAVSGGREHDDEQNRQETP